MNKNLKMMITALLSAALIGISLVGCGNTKPSDESSAAASSAQDTSSSNSQEESIEEKVLIDEKGIKITATGFGKNDSELFPSEKALFLEIVNGSEQPITVGLVNSSVNGYMVQSDLSLNVEPGETNTLPAQFDETQLTRCGITTFSEMGFVISIENYETFETILESEPISINTTANVTVDYDESGTVAYDKDGIKIVLKGTYEEEYLGQCIGVYVSNQSDKNITVAGAEKVSVNGKEVTPYFGSDVMKEKHDITHISFDEAENISKIESFEGSFCIYDYDTGDVLVEKPEPVSVAYE